MKPFRSVIFLIPITILPIIFILGIIDHNQANSTDVKSNVVINNEAMLMSVLWHQTSAEYRALCYQAFNIATNKLDEELAKQHSKKLAIVADVDETILDNSPYNAGNIAGKMDYPDDFYRWVNSASCKSVPGALEFMQYAAKNDVSIFYVTNRRKRGKDGTIKNLQDLGFPSANSQTVLFKTKQSSKQERRNFVLEEHEIVLYLGDNLLDFSDLFKADSFNGRKDAVDLNSREFGDKFIMLPNAMHGEWTKMISKEEKNLTDAEKTLKHLKLLEAFE